jgi:S-methylmethionine-dependent homocysteine/selenocysteine methylase
VPSDTLSEEALWQGRRMHHRPRLPQLDAARPFLTDGGLETTLIFHRGLDLPCFAAFDLLKHEGGRDELRAYFEPYVDLARDQGAGFVLDTATWRANPDWAGRLGYSLDELDAANRDAVALAEQIRAAGAANGTPIVINGVIGPRGDGYDPGELMSPEEAERYHARQVATFADSAADMVTAVTMTHAEEAIGIARAARARDLPAVISFTVETDGRLPDGQPLGAAIERVDAETGGSVAYFMINCAHPSHFADVLEDDGAWRERIRGLRANASAKSHAELDEAEELDEGDPAALGAEHGALRPRLGSVAVLGGCCGTDCRHVEAIGRAWKD